MNSININGWLNIDKPLGMSSAKVVGIIKRLLQLRRNDKIGHGGTLDPLATGVLPIALGEATKTVSYVMDGRKGYDFSIFFGEERDTGDAEGRVTASGGRVPTIEEVLGVLPELTGTIKQTPHKYSAIKVDGQRAYDLARSGEEFELKAREVTIYTLQCSGNEGNVFHFSLECSKGTYVRSLALDIAGLLGTLGYVSALRRTRCANFKAADTILLDSLEKIIDNGEIERYLLPIKDTLDDISGIALTEEDARRLRHGQRLKIPGLNGHKEVLKAECNNKLIAIACADGDILRPVRVFSE